MSVQDQAAEPDLLHLRRGSFNIGDPWAVPAGTRSVSLTKSADGSTPRLPTTCSLYWDDARIYALFQGLDDHIVATYRNRDDPLYTEDVVELYLAPETLIDYMEVEVSPLGSIFDARVHSPDGNRHTMQVDTSWDCDGLMTALRREFTSGRDEFRFDTVIAIPFASLDRPRPAIGETWRGNLYRIDRNPPGRNEFTAWRPTGKYPADFHVPEVFGRFRFEE